MKRDVEFMRRWLHGATCSRHKRTIAWRDGPFILAKHHGHGEYINMWTGTLWCETYYALYDLRDKLPDSLGKPDIKRWEGRWNRAKQQELELIVENLKRARTARYSRRS